MPCQLSNMPFMRRQRCSWLLALLLVAGALAFTSCVNQEGVAPAEGELKGGLPREVTDKLVLCQELAVLVFTRVQTAFPAASNKWA